MTSNIITAPETGASQRHAVEEVVPPIERYNPNFFAQFPPYKLSGPTPDLHRPDVYRVVMAARRYGYKVVFMEGLVLMVGHFGTWDHPASPFMVMFDNKYHQRFSEASAYNLLITSLPDLLQYMQEHPIPE